MNENELIKKIRNIFCKDLFLIIKAASVSIVFDDRRTQVESPSTSGITYN